jgi:hypothetical protein
MQHDVRSCRLDALHFRHVQKSSCAASLDDDPFQRRAVDELHDDVILLGNLILADGQLQANMPKGRQLVYMSADRTEFVIEFNRVRAGVVKEAIDALAPYLK